MSETIAAQPRVDYPAFNSLAPAAAAGLRALTTAVDQAGLEKDLTELVKVRASQINGCAFCLQFHLGLARKAGVDPVKLDLVAAWRDAGVFTAREQAALAWTETLTAVAQSGAPDAVYDRLRQHFSETEAVFLTVTIGSINAWNRIAVGLRFAPPAAQRTGGAA